MWLEEFVWAWLPVVGGIGAWLLRSHLMLKAEVQRLHRRLAELETDRKHTNQHEQRWVA